MMNGLTIRKSTLGYVLAIAVAIVGFSANSSISCDCVNYQRLKNETDEQYTKRIDTLQISQSEIVVEGLFVKSIHRALFSRLERRFVGDSPEYTGDLAGGVFRVERVIKGRVTSREIKVFTDVDGAACGASYLIAESLGKKRRLAFSIVKVGNGTTGKYRTSSCVYRRWLDGKQ
jgi:hypothetical protein